MEQSLEEELIRPDDLFNRFLSLAEADIRTYFMGRPFSHVPCPACGGYEGDHRFRKLGFDYQECTDCHTLFVNPRPESGSFRRYYTEAPSVQFWATHFYRETEASRRQLLIRPKAAQVKVLMDRYLEKIPAGALVADIGAGYGVFCEELRYLLPEESSVVAIEPAASLQEICRGKAIPVIPSFVEDMSMADLGGRPLVMATAFELLEHLHDPSVFLQSCRGLLSDGGLLILTTLNWEGFDLQVLGKYSRSIFPPHHINFFTPASVRTILSRNGFLTLEVSTPGKLDVDISAKQMNHVTDPFLRRILSAPSATRERFQEFLRESGFSSHMMVAARKRPE